MLKFIKDLDLTSPSPKLLVNSNTYYKNAFGGLLTIIWVFLITIISLVFIVKLFNREDIFIILNEEPLVNQSLDFNRFPIFFQIYDENGLPHTDAKRMFSISAIFYIKNFFGTPLMPLSVLLQKDIHIVNCSEYYENFNIQPSVTRTIADINNSTASGAHMGDILADINLQDKLCVDLTSVDNILSGKLGDDNSTYISLIIKRCSNSTANGFTCLSNNNIDKQQMRFLFSVSFLDNSINNYLLPNPTISYIKNEMITFSPKISKKVNYYFTNIEYITDNGLVFNDISQLTFPKLADKDEDFHIPLVGDDFLRVNFTLSGTRYVYFRKFAKFYSILASLYASAKILLLLFIAINKLLNEYSYYNYICNYINIYEYSDQASPDGNYFINNYYSTSFPKEILRNNFHNKMKTIKINTNNPNKAAGPKSFKNVNKNEINNDSNNKVEFSSKKAAQAILHQQQNSNRVSNAAQFEAYYKAKKRLKLQCKSDNELKENIEINKIKNFSPRNNTNNQNINSNVNNNNNITNCNLIINYDNSINDVGINHMSNNNLEQNNEKSQEINQPSADEFINFKNLGKQNYLNLLANINQNSNENYNYDNSSRNNNHHLNDISSNKLGNLEAFKDNIADYKKLYASNQNLLENSKLMGISNSAIPELNRQNILQVDDWSCTKCNSKNKFNPSNIKCGCANIYENNKTKNINLLEIIKNMNALNVINMNTITENNKTFPLEKIRFKLSIKNYHIIFRRILCRKSSKIEALEKGINYVRKKISIEEVIRKMLDIDKLKFMLLNPEKLHHLFVSKGPDIFTNFSKGSSELVRQSNSKYDSNSYKNSRDYLWKFYEFDNSPTAANTFPV